MRTKHILTALALPALFAACTADEFESVNVNNGGAQQARPTVGENFTLTTGNADTRYAAEETGSGIRLNFTQGDLLGAAIIDNYVPGKDPYDFEVIPSLAGNNPFEFQGGDQWTSNTRLGIGHYLFKYRYNPNDNNRAAATFELPTVQKLYTDENGEVDLTAAIEAGNMAIAATVLTEGQQTADASLKNLFTYPKVQINFDNGEKVNTVSQVVLEYKNAITVKGGFNHKVVANLFADAPKDLNDEDYWDKETQSVIWDEVETADFLIAENDADAKDFIPYPANERTSKYIVVKFPKNTQVKLDSNTKNKYVEARFMMPSVEDFSKLSAGSQYEDADITMYVYTDNGIYRAPIARSSFLFKETTTDEVLRGALGRGKGYNLTLNKNVLVKDNADNIVTTVEDWNALVRDFGASENPQSVAIVGDEFAFDSETIFPTKSTFIVTTNLNVKGNVEISNVNMSGNTINVLENATLTVNNTLANANIVNEGTVNMAAKADKDKNAYDGVSLIENEAKATLNIVAGADAAFELHNAVNADVVVAKGGKMTVNGNNKGEITNNGLVNTTTNFVSVKYDNNNKLIVPTPTITNNKGAQFVSIDGTTTNNALFVNNGELTCLNRNGKIENKGELQSPEGAVTYITDNEDGTIVVTEANPATLTIDNNIGIVKYTTEESSETFSNGYVNTVIASGNYEVKGTNTISLTLNGEGTLKASTASIDKLTVNGSTTLGANLTVAGLTVAENAMVNVPGAYTMTVTGADYENYGRILVGGNFIAEKVLRSNGGNVQNEGQGEIRWQDDADKEAALEAAKGEYEAALKGAIEFWANYTFSGGKLTVNNLDYNILQAKATDMFVEFLAANDDKEAVETLYAEFNAYHALDNSVAITDSYNAVAGKIVADNEAAVKALKLTWTPTANTSRANAHIYKDLAEAMKAFKAAVAGGTVTISSQLHKVVICSSETNFMPACSYVLESEPLYQMFEFIENGGGWRQFGFSYEYMMTSANLDGWDLEHVRNWISDVRKSTNTSAVVQDAVDFVETNDLWNASKTWTYSEELIQGIVNDYIK